MLCSTLVCAQVSFDKPADSRLVEEIKSAPYKGHINISAFAYRDINRNGVYDLGDRPYAGLKVALRHPEKEEPVEVTSNIGGFANFEMSLNNPEHHIDVPGTYRVSAAPGNTCEITSGNSEQSLKVRTLIGSPGGMFVEETLTPIGVAPKLTISGQLFELPPETVLLAVHEQEKERRVDIQKTGHFSFPAQKGNWTLEVKFPDARVLTRKLRIDNYPVYLSRWTPGAQHAEREADQGRVIHFDDLTRSDTLHEIPNQYGDLKWTNWIATHQKLYGGVGYINNTTSGEYLAYNSSGHPATIHSDTPFQFIGGYFGVAWPQAESGDVFVAAWRGEELLYEDQFRCSTERPVYFSANYKDVTKIEFSTDRYWQFTMDDVAVRTGD